MSLDESQGIADEGQAVTPSDVVTFAEPSVLYIGGTGDIRVDMARNGTNLLFTGVIAGTFLPILVSRVYATGTTATSITRIF